MSTAPKRSSCHFMIWNKCPSQWHYTYKHPIFTLMPIIKNLHHEGVIKMKNNGNVTIEQCLRHNILKFERKFMDYWDTRKRLKKFMPSYMKINFFDSYGNIMISDCTWGQNDTWNHIYIPSSFRILKENWGSQAILRSYGRLKTVMFFAIFAHKSVLTHAQTFNFDALDLFIARKWLKWQHKQQYKTVAAYFIVSSIPHFRNTCMRIMYQLITIRLGIVDSHEK